MQLIGPPIIILLEPVVDECCILTGLRAVVRRVSDVFTDLASHLRVYGLDGTLRGFLLVGPFILSF